MQSEQGKYETKAAKPLVKNGEAVPPSGNLIIRVDKSALDYIPGDWWRGQLDKLYAQGEQHVKNLDMVHRLKRTK